jgi:hypothetical protein
LKYSETRPGMYFKVVFSHVTVPEARHTSLSAFIRGLLENVGPQIDPIRLIRRIRNGLEIPGLKEALIKILWDFNLQVTSSSQRGGMSIKVPYLRFPS